MAAQQIIPTDGLQPPLTLIVRHKKGGKQMGDQKLTDKVGNVIVNT